MLLSISGHFWASRCLLFLNRNLNRDLRSRFLVPVWILQQNRTESTRIHHGGSETLKNVNKFVRVICGMIFGHLRRCRRPVSHKAEPGPTGTKSWIWGPGFGSSVQKYQACGWSETLINTQNPLELPGMWFWICLEPLGTLRAPASHKAQPGPTTGTSGPGSKIPSLWLFRDTQKHTRMTRGDEADRRPFAVLFVLIWQGLEAHFVLRPSATNYTISAP